MRVISIVPLPLRRVTKKTFRIDEIGIIRNEFVCAGGLLMSKHWQTGKYLTNLTYRKHLKILKFGTPQTIAIIVLKIIMFDVTLHLCIQKMLMEWQTV